MRKYRHYREIIGLSLSKVRTNFGLPNTLAPSYQMNLGVENTGIETKLEPYQRKYWMQY